MQEAGLWILEHVNDIVDDVMTGYDHIEDDYIHRKIKEDTHYNTLYMGYSLGLSSAMTYRNYIAWLREVMVSLNMDEMGVLRNLKKIQDSVSDRSNEEVSKRVHMLLTEIYEDFDHEVTMTETYFLDSNPLITEAKKYCRFLLEGKRDEAFQLIRDVLASHDVREVYIHIFQVCQYEIGRLWQRGEISVATEHYCTAATQLIMSRLYPLVFRTKIYKKKIVACCIGKELHEMGIRMIADLLEMEGYDTYYLGSNTPIKEIKHTVMEQNSQILLLSTTMMENIPEIETLIEELHADDRLQELKVYVGGHPFNQDEELYKRIGADGYAVNAMEAISMIMEESRG